MHPPLDSKGRTDKCTLIIQKFQQCHKDVGFFGKMMNKCADLKKELDKCLKEEFEMKRKVNMEKAEKIQEMMKKNSIYIERLRKEVNEEQK
jgi:hypothetical protein